MSGWLESLMDSVDSSVVVGLIHLELLWVNLLRCTLYMLSCGSLPKYQASYIMEEAMVDG